MKKRPTLLQKLWRKVRRPKAVQPSLPKRGQPERKPASTLEPLEGRISPAALLNPTTLLYKDLDGDLVTVKFSKALFAELSLAANLVEANAVFKFNSGDVSGNTFDAATAPPQQLQLIDLTKAPTKGTLNLATGTGLTITVVKGSLPGVPETVQDDGFANVGYINATGLPLGAISIAGDLGRIDAGNVNAVTGLAALKVKSIGVADKAVTQIAAGVSLNTNITGALGSLTVSDDIKEASIRVRGRIGAVNIGGALNGRTAVEAASDNTGLIQADGDIGAIKVGTDITKGGIAGGGGKNAGAIIAGGRIASLTVSGNVSGAQGEGSGSIVAGSTLGPATIKGDLAGGSGKNSGRLQGGVMGAVNIGDDLVAGSGSGSGVIASTGLIGAVKVLGEIDATASGASTVGAGGIQAGGKIASVAVTGALKGGAGLQTGFIDGANDIGAVVLHDIVGGSGINSGTITAAGRIASVTVKGNVTGGTAFGAGSIFSGLDSELIADIGAVRIGGKLEGGSQENTGLISSGGKIASVTVGPALPVGPPPADQAPVLKGGAGNSSGAIFSRGTTGPVKIYGHVQGGAGDFSGAIVSGDFITAEVERAGDLGAVIITGHVQGGAGSDSGQIHADGKLASATIGDLIGAGGARSGSIRAGQGEVNPGITGKFLLKGGLTGGTDAQSGGIFSEGRITSVTVIGAVNGGTIRAGNDIGALTFKSDVQGIKIAARGQAVQSATADRAIGRIAISGNVANSQFLAGYDTSLVASNPDAQIGAVSVTGTWTASDLVAGVSDAGAAGFGTLGDHAISGPDNANIVSQIASIVIGGSVSGTASPTTDHFGFTAQKIGSFRAAGVPHLLMPLLTDQPFDVAPDVTVREIA